MFREGFLTPGAHLRSRGGCSRADGVAPAVSVPSQPPVTVFGRAPHDYVALRKVLRVSATVVPLFVLAALLLPSLPPLGWLAVIPVGALIAKVVAGGRAYSGGVYVNLILPLYYASVLLLPLLPLPSWGARLAALGAAVALGAVRMGIMTVCLHRYAAHAAFRCHWIPNLALGVLSCFANQSGPLWWASKHRCHHKFCDGPMDPHSPNARTQEEAFSFFTEARHEPIDERFAPRHCDTPGMRIIDAFSSVPLLLESCLAYSFFGVVGLWVSYLSAWMCQAATLWFNVVSHASPPVSSAVEGCRASDYFGWTLPGPMFLPLQLLVAGIFPFIGERAHKHHHDNPGLARRPGLDMPYFFFVRPLELLGLVRDCRIERKTLAAA